MAPERKHSTDAILDAARAIVLAEGARAATIAAIAAGSEAPAGTLYHRFGSRDGILAAAWLRAVERFQARALAAASTGDPLEAGVAMARATVAFSAECPQDAQLLLALRRRDLLDGEPADLRALNAPLERQLRRVARELFGSASARSLDRVARAVVDLPYAAVRRHAGAVPPWLEADVAGDVRRLLTACARPES
jgi:AcrR family transcriptional regulator